MGESMLLLYFLLCGGFFSKSRGGRRKKGSLQDAHQEKQRLHLLTVTTSVFSGTYFGSWGWQSDSNPLNARKQPRRAISLKQSPALDVTRCSRLKSVARRSPATSEIRFNITGDIKKACRSTFTNSRESVSLAGRLWRWHKQSNQSPSISVRVDGG